MLQQWSTKREGVIKNAPAGARTSTLCEKVLYLCLMTDESTEAGTR